MARKLNRRCPVCSKALSSQGYASHVRAHEDDGKRSKRKRTDGATKDRDVPRVQREVLTERARPSPGDETSVVHTVTGEQQDVAAKLAQVFPAATGDGETVGDQRPAGRADLTEPSEATSREGEPHSQEAPRIDGAAPPPTFNVDALLAYADVACAAVVGFATARGAKLPTDELAQLSRLSDGERAQLRPLLEQGRPVLERWLRPTPEGAVYTALGLLAFGLWARWRTATALERATRDAGNAQERASAPEAPPPVAKADAQAAAFQARSMPGNPIDRL